MVTLSVCKQALNQKNSLWQWRNSFCPYQCMLVVAECADTWNRGGLKLVPTRSRKRWCGRKVASLVCLWSAEFEWSLCETSRRQHLMISLERNWLLEDSYALRWIKGFSCLMHKRHGWPKSHRDIRSQCVPVPAHNVQGPCSMSSIHFQLVHTAAEDLLDGEWKQGSLYVLFP